MRSNGIDVKLSSLSALDVFMEPGKAARVRCGACGRMQKVARGLMVSHFNANAEQCPGSHTHYVFDRSYDQWAGDLGMGADAWHKRFSAAHVIDPRARHATRVSPVRYPAKPGPLHRSPSRPNQATGHSPDRVDALDAAKKITPVYPAAVADIPLA